MATDIETQHNGLSLHETIEDKKPTSEAEWINLRRVPDKLPMVALLILAVEVRQNAVDLTGYLTDAVKSSVNVLHTSVSVDPFRTI
jgi:hypothetical protein